MSSLKQRSSGSRRQWRWALSAAAALGLIFVGKHVLDSGGGGFFDTIASLDAPVPLAPPPATVPLAATMGDVPEHVVFKDTPLAEAVVEINRYRRHPIVIDDTQARALRIEGTYLTSQADRFPELLVADYPLKLTVLPSGETVLATRR